MADVALLGGLAQLLRGFDSQAVIQVFDAFGAEAGDGFGADVASLGDVDGDGLADLALTTWSEVSLLPPAIAVHTSTGKTIDLPGFWRVRRIASPPGSAPRLAAFSLASWSRFGRVPMGSRAQVAILELRLGGR